MTASNTEESGEQSSGGGRSSPARERTERRGHWLVFFAALGVLFVGLVLLRDVWRGNPVAAPFTRVGGATHVETAVYASRFWLTSPQYVVTTPANADEQTMLGAARCAMAHDAPLLFTSKNRARQRLVDATINDWHHDATALHPAFPQKINVNGQGDVASCLANGRPADARGLSTLTLAHPLLRLSGIQTQDTPAPNVVFAAAWEPGFIPDIAVGMALGAHMATPHQPISLIVVPRYLEADPALERKLESRHNLVRGGVVLGQTMTVPDDTRALLRQLLTSTDKQGALKQLDATLGSVEPLVGALLALIGAGVAAGTAPKAIPQIVKLTYQMSKLVLAGFGAAARAALMLILQAAELIRKILIRVRILKPGGKSIMAIRDKGEAGGTAAPPAGTDWRDALEGNPRVIVWLRSGKRADGILNQWYPTDAGQKKGRGHAAAQTILRLNEVTLTINGARQAPMEFLLIPVADIELIAKSYPDRPSPDQSS